MEAVLSRSNIIDKPGSLCSKVDREKDIKRSEIARERIRARRNVSTWHEGFCLECAFNPYNMVKPSKDEQLG